MPVLEKKIEEAVSRYAEDFGVIQIKLNLIGRRGWPDRLFLHKGQVLFIEFKAPTEEPRKLQLYIHGMLRANGFEVVVVDNVEDGIFAINNLASQKE